MSNSTEPDPNQQFAIVELIPGQPPPANVIGGGPLDMILSNLSDSVARAEQMRALDMARLDDLAIHNAQAATRAIQAQALCDLIDNTTRRLDQLEARRAAQAKADDEAEQRRVQDYLDSLPSPDDPLPHEPGNQFPSGDLHQVPPSEPEDKYQLKQSDQGNLPHELTEKAPPDLGTEPVFDPAELAYPKTPTQRAPAAIEE